MKKKTIALILSLILIVGGVIGGSIAWLTDKTNAVTNTFTVGDINIDLTETTGPTYKMVPGNEITKDPKVTVNAGSEDCWLFVKVEESASLDSYISYTVDSSKWTALPGVDGVYYCEVAASSANQDFPVLTGNKVTVKGDVTKTMMEALNASGATQPTLTFTAYAVQKANFATPGAAWAEANK